MNKIVLLRCSINGQAVNHYFNGDGELSIGNNRASILVHPLCASRRQVCIKKEDDVFVVRACGSAPSSIISQGKSVPLTKDFSPLQDGDIICCSNIAKFEVVIATAKPLPTQPTATTTSTPASSSANSSSSKKPSRIPKTPAAPKQYPESFYTTPRAMKLPPENVMPFHILNRVKTLPKPGKLNVFILFHIKISGDLKREKTEIDDICFCFAALGFNRIEVVSEATFRNCRLIMEDKIKNIKKNKTKIHSLCFMAASHGYNPSTERLNILLSDNNELDSALFTRWAFDLGAKHTFIVALTCHGENIAHGVVWPEHTSGGFVWASSSERTASFKYMTVTYADGTTAYGMLDTFIRALYELLFCVHGLVELENNISFKGLCSLWEVAHSVATLGRASFGSQPMWNGHEHPMRPFGLKDRLQVLHKGYQVFDAHVDENETVSWKPRKMKGRKDAGSTFITKALQEQIDSWPPWEEVKPLPDYDSEDERDRISAATKNIEKASSSGVSIIEDDGAVALEDTVTETSFGDDDEVESASEESDGNDSDSPDAAEESLSSSKAILLLTGITVNLDKLDDENRRKSEQQVVRKFNSLNGSTCGKACRCGKRLVGYKHPSSTTERERFGSMGLRGYYMPISSIKCASSCSMNC